MRASRWGLVVRVLGAVALGQVATFLTAWLVLLTVGGLDGPAGMLAGMLGADPPGVIVAAAAATGGPVRWTIADLGVSGQVWPVNLLGSAPPLALLLLAPLVGALLTGSLLSGGLLTGRRRFVLVAPVVGALTAALAALAGAVPQAGGLGVVRTNPWMVLLFSTLWALALLPAGAALRRAVRTVPRRPALAGAVTLVLVCTLGLVVGSNPVAPAPVAGDGPTREAAPVGYQVPGVRDALARLKQDDPQTFNATVDPWRGVPSVMSMHSRLGDSVAGWLRHNAALFAVTDPVAQLKQVRSVRDQLGQRHVWYDQVVDGVPVYAARVGVHLDATGGFVQTLSNGMQPRLAPTATKATLPRAGALAAVAHAVPGGRVVGTPQLYLLPGQPRPGQPTVATLSWRVVWADRAAGEDGVQAYFVAATGTARIVRTLPVSEPAVFRVVYDYANTTEPQAARVEGQAATGRHDLDAVYEYDGAFYDYYKKTFGRDSYNDSGAHLSSWARWSDVPGQPYLNAYWDGEKTVFGEGLATVDIVGHEWTHAVVEKSANLQYVDQAGALNESFADIFGEMTQLDHTGHLDWLMGAGSALGVIRSFSSPNDYGQPDHLRDYLNDCFDSGGVHTNSGIPNKAFYVLAQRIGTAKASAVEYRALTTYLHPMSGFTDARNSTIQAAWDLYGKSSQEAKEVWRAWGSVGVDGIAEPDLTSCVCFAEASLHGTGLDVLEKSGMDSGAVAGALLRIRDLLAGGRSPALAHYGAIYSQANAQALRLLTTDADLQRATAHAMQSFAPLLATVDTPAGDGVIATRELIGELVDVGKAYMKADLAHGDGKLAGLLDHELAAVDTGALVGMTVNQVKAYLDRLFDGTAPAGTTPGGSHGVVDPAVERKLAAGGTSTVMVQLRDTADLGGTAGIRDRVTRIKQVGQRLGLTAQNSQRNLTRLLSARGVAFEQFWIVNAVLVRGADSALVGELARLGEVKRIRLPGTLTVPATTTDDANKKLAEVVTQVEWGIHQIHADDVWSKTGVRGAGIVVANVDTGVQFDHPALANQYRGHRPDGTFDHNYNWYDAPGACTTPAPCDDNGHGTHTMGTMVGDDGTNHIGVAPGATWIAARGCESSSCSEEAMLRAGQWMLAPTDLNGQNPRPDLAPHVINNSWGGGQGDTFYDGVINAWVQAGIFPVFAGGNEGPGCETATSPGDNEAVYAAGAFAETGAIASFSSRGSSSASGETKPNIAAPGVNVRSAIPFGGFGLKSGTSMAAPHVAGTVALMWSAAPGLVGDIAATRQLLDDTAVDVPDVSCGGSDDDNNVWGEGRLDAYSAVAFAPQGVTGSIIGAVTDSHGAPIVGAQVSLTGTDGAHRAAVTDEAGTYSAAVPAGTYQIVVHSYGYRDGAKPVTAGTGGSVRADVTLFLQPRYPLQGDLTHAGAEVTGAPVTLQGSRLPATVTGGDGEFGFGQVPAGTYTVLTGASQCAGPGSLEVTVAWDKMVTVAAADRTGDYTCSRVAHAFPATGTVLPLTGDDATTAVPLPFAFPFYGKFYDTAYVSTNGSLSFGYPNASAINGRLPGVGTAAIHPFWDDLVVDEQSQVRTSGTAAGFTVEWRNVTFADDPAQRATFAVSLGDDGVLRLHYGSLSSGNLARGGSATVGIGNEQGTAGIEYNRDQPLLTPDTTVEFAPQGGFVAGTVSTAAGAPVAGAAVTSPQGRSATTDAAGHYRLFLPAGEQTLQFTHPDFTARSATVTVLDGRRTVTLNLTMDPGPSTVSGVVTGADGTPVAGAVVTLIGGALTTPVTTTDDQGRYTLDGVPAGTATIQVTALCNAAKSSTITVDGDRTLDFTLVPSRDTAGYTCARVTYEPIAAGTPVALVGDDVMTTVPIGFPMPFYGGSYETAAIGSNGFLGFDPATAQYSNGYNTARPPNTGPVNGALYAFTDDLVIDGSSQITTLNTGTGADRRLVVQWANVLFYGGHDRVTFQAILYADGRMRVQFVDLPDSSDGRGGDAGVGIENLAGTDGLAASWDSPTLLPGMAIEFRPPAG